MEYSFKGDLKKLEGALPVGDGECVRIVQHYAKAPRTPYWRAGRRVLDAAYIPPGTAIATFKSPTSAYVNAKGNHAALFMYAGPKDASGQPQYIVVMDQWKGRGIRSRTIRRYTAEEAKIRHIYDSDNAAAFYVIQ